jgi:hypothetical protein
MKSLYKERLVQELEEIGMHPDFAHTLGSKTAHVSPRTVLYLSRQSLAIVWYFLSSPCLPLQQQGSHPRQSLALPASVLAAPT